VDFALHQAPGKDASTFVEFVRACPFLLDPELFMQYYSRKLIFHTPDSMAEFQLPDKKPLPAIVAFSKSGK